MADSQGRISSQAGSGSSEQAATGFEDVPLDPTKIEWEVANFNWLQPTDRRAVVRRCDEPCAYCDPAFSCCDGYNSSDED